MASSDDLRFVAPDGSELIAPSEAFIRETFSKGARFWLSDACDAALLRGDRTRGRGLVFAMARGGRGFLIMHRDGVEELLLRSVDERQGTATVCPGGDPWTIGKTWVVSRDIALEAAVAFLRRAGRPEVEGHRWAEPPAGDDDE